MPLHVVVPPRRGVRTEGRKQVVAQINGLTLAGAALVDELAGDGLAVQGDGGHAAAVRISV